MSFSDPLGDMLTRIRNAIMRNRTSVSTPCFESSRACTRRSWLMRVSSEVILKVKLMDFVF